MINTSHIIVLQSSTGQVGGKQRYGINSVSFKPSDDIQLKLADYFNIGGVFRIGSISDRPNGGRLYTDMLVMGADYRAFVEIVFENPSDIVLSYHIDGFFIVGKKDGWRRMDTSNQAGYNLRDGVARSTIQVYPKSWSALYV
ncbi:unnamed protein product [Lactuca virosa]|uniref:Plastocyanin-like domain-containing protein n=1 Tax=Lactuca virosa TaxID=75947 RepID=A0AAU9P817_9ASTR|nr:unnamed protein product [Lactuca virosa]